MILFFIFTLLAKQDEPINQKYKDSSAVRIFPSFTKFTFQTYHSWVSVRNTGFCAFTKTTRYAQIFVSTSIWCFIHTLFLQMNHPEYGENDDYNIVTLTLIPTVVGLAVSCVVTHITGSILMNLAKVHREYAQAYKSSTTMDQKVVLEDKYEGQKANRYFAFFVLTLIIFQILSWEAIWMQEDFSSNYKWYYFINIFASCLIEWLVLDWIRVVLGSGDGTGIGACLKRRGFWYDYSLQDLFDQIDEDD